METLCFLLVFTQGSQYVLTLFDPSYYSYTLHTFTVYRQLSLNFVLGLRDEGASDLLEEENNHCPCILAIILVASVQMQKSVPNLNTAQIVMGCKAWNIFMFLQWLGSMVITGVCDKKLEQLLNVLTQPTFC